MDNKNFNQNTFTETIHAVAEIIRTSAEPLSREEILGYFKEMDLTSEQENMVLEYLLTPHNEELVPAEEEPDTEEKVETPENCMPDSKVFQMYLEELEGLPVYEEPEINNMYKDLLNGDKAAVQKLTDVWMRKVLDFAKQMATSTEGFEDVVQEGNISLFMKLTELCGSKDKIDVEEVLSDAIRTEMKRCISEFAGEDNEEKAIVCKVNLVNEAKKYLMDKNGTEPTADELADYTKLKPEELQDILTIIDKAQKKNS